LLITLGGKCKTIYRLANVKQTNLGQYNSRELLLQKFYILADMIIDLGKDQERLPRFVRIQTYYIFLIHLFKG
jgi:hypothetical protein